jgi:transcriptional regulator with XRE-family HTH domain/tetratricopeptide (TPR) repeat protein
MDRRILGAAMALHTRRGRGEEMASDQGDPDDGFGDLLRRFRRAAGLTQGELAERARISVRGLSDLERGINRAPRRYTLLALAAALQLAPDERAALAAAAARRPDPASPPSARRMAAGRNPEPASATPQPLAASAPGPSAEVAPLHAFAAPFDDALLPVPDTFVGRAADLAWLLDRLHRGPGATAITALGGMGGIGKTSLAAMAVRQLRAEGRFPDGIAVLQCTGLVSEAAVLCRVLTRFDPYRRALDAEDTTRLSDAARALLAGKDALIILDDVQPDLRVADVVMPLRAAGSTLLLTARQTLPRDAVSVAASRSLDLLAPEEALEVFAAALGRGGADALSPGELAAARRIVAALDRHTLAVKLAGAYAADARRDLGALARELDDPGRALDLPHGETPRAMALVFAQSTRALPPDARRLFVALAAFGTAEFGRRAALAIASALGQSSPEASLHLLVLRALVEPAIREALPEGTDRERLRIHALLGAFAQGLFARWPVEERESSYAAVVRYYADYAERHQSDHAGLAADERNLMGALEWALAREQHDLVAHLVHGLGRFWRERGMWREALRYLPLGIAAAGRHQASNPPSRLLAADMEVTYGSIQIYAGKSEEAGRTLRRGLQGFRAAKDRRGEGEARWQLGVLAFHQGRLQQAEDSMQKALVAARQAGDRRGEGEYLCDLGYVALRCGQLRAAEDYLLRSVRILRALGHRRGEAGVLGYLGQVALQRGRLEQAEAFLSRSLAVFRDARERRNEGAVLSDLAYVILLRGRTDEAEASLRLSLTIRREVQDRTGEGVDLTYLGQVALRADGWRGLRTTCARRWRFIAKCRTCAGRRSRCAHWLSSPRRRGTWRVPRRSIARVSHSPSRPPAAARSPMLCMRWDDCLSSARADCRMAVSCS